MPATEQAVEIDEKKLEAFMGQAVGDLGATLSAALVVIGDQLGLYKAMAGAGRLTPARAGRAHRHRRALRARVAERPGRRRLRRPTTRRPGTLHAAAGAGARARRRGEPGLPLRRVPAHHIAGPRRSRRSARRSAPARASAGTSTTPACSRAPSASSGPATSRNLVSEWIPALDGVEAKLRRGATRRRRRLRARRLHDPHGAGVPEVDVRRLRLPRGVDRGGARAGRAKRASPTACASRWRRRTDFPGTATTSSRSSTACTTWAIRSAPRATCARRSPPTARWLIVEPFAGDQVEDNLNPVGRVFYGASTLSARRRRWRRRSALGARRAGRRGAPARRRHHRRLHALPARHRDAVQPRARSASVATTTSRGAALARRSDSRVTHIRRSTFVGSLDAEALSRFGRGLGRLFLKAFLVNPSQLVRGGGEPERTFMRGWCTVLVGDAAARAARAAVLPFAGSMISKVVLLPVGVVSAVGPQCLHLRRDRIAGARGGSEHEHGTRPTRGHVSCWRGSG